MPTYSFHCPTGHDFDVFERKISDKMKAKCPKCGKMATRQISGGAGLHFKGSGFYITDYKGDKKGQKGQETPKGEGGAGKDESKGGKNESSAPSAPPPSSDK